MRLSCTHLKSTDVAAIFGAALITISFVGCSPNKQILAWCVQQIGQQCNMRRQTNDAMLQALSVSVHTRQMQQTKR